MAEATWSMKFQPFRDEPSRGWGTGCPRGKKGRSPARIRSRWQIRIGIHTGQAIGSVVGTKKYIYDVFGDTVNTASRLQTCSKPMKINVSREVVDQLGAYYPVETRGIVQVKGKKAMEMFFVDWPRPIQEPEGLIA